ncbi:transmembrane anchor protein [Vibrio maerlii]|uniref:transmembrane anchor protein n=1 Tax=Vibrio maerlii TaxID=2231648 RepID=UPI000E3E761E|nr:transmembrane anchor protein [Vibrio maerlii]
MYNSEMPTKAELPSTKQLLKSTIIALLTAVVLLVTVILPAEYAIDPTGIGRALGLAEMGEIKTQLAEEAAADEARDQALALVTEVEQPIETPVVESLSKAVTAEAEVSNSSEPVWKDRMLLSLKPGQGAEVKLAMKKGQVAEFEWVSKGGPVNYDTHGDGNGNSISYEKGRGVPNGEGELVAAFTGNHGWFFRNRNDQQVMVIIKAKGEYSKMKRML